MFLSPKEPFAPRTTVVRSAFESDAEKETSVAIYLDGCGWPLIGLVILEINSVNYYLCKQFKCIYFKYLLIPANILCIFQYLNISC